MSTTVTFKKGPKRPITSRKRDSSPSAGEPGPSTTAPETSVVRPTKKSLANPLVQGTKRRRDLNDDSTGGLDELDYAADDSVQTSKGDVFATRSTDWDLESEPLKEKKIRLNEDGDIDDGLYHGASGYLTTINKTREVLDKKMKTAPIRATANIRTITLMDYQPDVCKDYKETGFCGYGDSCKFLHDRGDYLAGWQLDKLDPGAGPAVAEEDEEEEVPFACLICRQPFTDPIVTKCGHYFCMKFIKSPKCYACGAPTSGIFNKAEKILAKLEANNKRKREAKGLVDEEEEDGGIEIGGASDPEDTGGIDNAGEEEENEED